MKQLLKREAQERLGAKGGFDEIRRHPWFKDVDWNKVYNKQLGPKQYREHELKPK